MRSALILILSLLFVPLVYAQSNYTESLTITTYYPSPYGVYRDMEIHRSIKYKPQSDVNTVTNPSEGQLVYVDSNPSDAIPGEFKFWGGGAWQAQSSGGGGVAISLKCNYYGDIPSGCSCTPQSCPAGWTAQGTIGCANTAYAYYAGLHCLGYCERWCTK